MFFPPVDRSVDEKIEIKRFFFSFQPSKMLKLETSPASSPKKPSAERIAQEKKRLQQLEYEYALKIQKLKEARALQNKEQSNTTPHVEEESEFALPQPSLHDLTQDKLTLDSEENYCDDEVLSNSNRERRRSFRESNSFTKPNLKHMDTPKQETINKLSKKASEEPELFLGLNIDELKKLHAKADSLKELLMKSTASVVPKEDLLCGQVNVLQLNVKLVFVRCYGNCCISVYLFSRKFQWRWIFLHHKVNKLK